MSQLLVTIFDHNDQNILKNANLPRDGDIEHITAEMIGHYDQHFPELREPKFVTIVQANQLSEIQCTMQDLQKDAKTGVFHLKYHTSSLDEDTTQFDVKVKKPYPKTVTTTPRSEGSHSADVLLGARRRQSVTSNDTTVNLHAAGIPNIGKDIRKAINTNRGRILTPLVDQTWPREKMEGAEFEGMQVYLMMSMEKAKATHPVLVNCTIKAASGVACRYLAGIGLTGLKRNPFKSKNPLKRM